MKLISWNVNGIRAILKKGFLEWLHQESPDILGIQETKAQTDQLTFDILHPNGYHTYWSSAERKGYSGVAVFSKKEPLAVQEGLGIPEFDTEGRTLMLEYDDFILFNVYFPNGSSGNRRVPFKMAFYEAFLEKVETLRGEGKNIIVCGDVNTAHMEIDLSRPKENIHNTGFLPQERAWITKLLEKGYLDTFRHFNPNPDNFTWWDYKTRARERNIGWRLDYFFISEKLFPKLKNASILKEVMGSDHCPVSIEMV